MHRRQLLACGAAAEGVPWVCAAPGVAAPELLIGQSIALQGGKNAYGVEVRAGNAAVLKPLDESGGLYGRRILLRRMDDANDARRAESNARELIAGGAFVLFGSIEGGPSTAVEAVAQAAGVPFIGPMAGSPTLRRPHRPMVFPVRAEHREEFRALIGWARRTGLQRMALLHIDAEVGRQHLENVRALCGELGAELAYGLPLKSGIDDAGLDAPVARLKAGPVQFHLNHGSALTYARLIRKARAAGVCTVFMGINSGSSELARELGADARGMVFAQAMPNPWARKTALVRDYKAAYAKPFPGHDFSYASLEGFVTARALVAGLRLAGADPTCAGLLRVLEAADLDLGDLPVRWRPGDHTGAHFVDLAIVTRDGGFLQ